MPGKLDQMPRYNNRQSGGGGANDSFDEEPTGIYLNEALLQTLAVIQGCEVTLKTKCGMVFSGIFVSMSPTCEVLLSTVHEVVPGQEDVLPIKADVADEMIFAFEDVVSFSATTDADSLSRVSSFAIDADISKQQRYNGVGADVKELEKWTPDEAHDEDDFFASRLEVQRGHDGGGDLGDGRGWAVGDMWEQNKKLGVDSTFDESLLQYTNVHPDDGDPDYLEKRATAERIAREIERDPVSRRHGDLENDDEERDLNRDNFVSAQHQRGGGSPRYGGSGYGRNRGPPPPDRRGGMAGGGQRLGPGAGFSRGDNIRTNIHQGGSLTFTNQERRRGGGGPRMGGVYSGQQPRYHERSPVGSAEDSNWREVKSRNSQRMDRRMDQSQHQQQVPVGSPGPGGGGGNLYSQPPPAPPTDSHPPRTVRAQLSRGPTKQMDRVGQISELKKFGEGFRLASTKPPQQSEGNHSGSGVGRGQEAERHPEPPAGAYPKTQEGPGTGIPPHLRRSASGPPPPTDGIQTVTAPPAPALVAEEHHPPPVQRHPRPHQVHIPPSPKQEKPGTPVKKKESLVAPPGTQEKTPDPTQHTQDITSSGKREFKFNPDAHVFTPRTGMQHPSPSITPTNAGQPIQGNPPLIHQLPQTYPAPAQSPAAAAMLSQAQQMAMYHPGVGGTLVSMAPVTGIPVGGGPQTVTAYYQAGIQPGSQIVGQATPVSVMQHHHPQQPQQPQQQQIPVQQYTQTQTAFTAPPPAIQGANNGNRPPQRPRMVTPVTPGGSVVGPPIMTPGVVAPAQQAQAPANFPAGLLQYPMSVTPAAAANLAMAPNAQQFLSQHRMVAPGGYHSQIVQDPSAQQIQIPYTTGVSRTQSVGEGQPGGLGNMAHPPPPSSNNSGASHSNNASQPPTPGPHSNPSPAPYHQQIPTPQYQQTASGHQVTGGYYMGPGNQMIPATTLVQIQGPQGSVQYLTYAQYQQVTANQFAALPQEQTFLAGYQDLGPAGQGEVPRS